jgi:hypothetical protein
MSQTLSEFNPKAPDLVIDGKRIKLSLLTLELEVVFSEQYGSLMRLFDVISEKPESLIEIIWEFVIDKQRFQYSPEEFKTYILTSAQSMMDTGKNLRKCFDESVSKSRPIVKNPDRAKVIRDISSAMVDESKATPCYAKYFDTVAKRYGFNIQDFYGLTLGQLHVLLKVIGDASYEELEVQAALQGRKLKPRMDFVDISAEDEADQDADAAEALARLKKAHEERNTDGR